MEEYLNFIQFIYGSHPNNYNFIIKIMKLILIPTILIAVAKTADLDYFNFGHVMQFLYGIGQGKESGEAEDIRQSFDIDPTPQSMKLKDDTMYSGYFPVENVMFEKEGDGKIIKK